MQDESPKISNILNYTPHAVHIVRSDDPDLNTTALPPLVIKPTGLARCKEEVLPDPLGGFFRQTKYGAVEGLPEYVPGVILIVSGLVVAALPERKDLYSPGGLVRDHTGAIIGCRYLQRPVG